ncbi:MAG: hypothetical protein JJE10_07150 [Thermoleophilia bacterium]|nr:hypothetical protein [Thermoleophilia bacterium]
MAAELRQRGLRVEVESIAVRPSEAGSVLLHASIALGAGLLGLKWPLVGAAVCLAVAFSFYAERALGLNLLGRLVPRRSSQNVVSPPTGPVWSGGIGIVLSAGYDIPGAYPVGEWLSRRLSGQLTSDRVVFWGGMFPLFVATMLRVTGIDGFGTGLLQLLSSAVLLSMIVAQLDRWMAGRPIAGDQDPAAPELLLEALDELLEAGGQEGDIAVCFFGCESASGAGATDFFGRAPQELGDSNATVVNFIAGDESADRVQITAREGDLTTLKMNSELGADSEQDPEPAILRSNTGALAARRSGIRAVTVVGRGDEAVDTALDMADAGLESVELRPDALGLDADDDHQPDDQKPGDSDRPATSPPEAAPGDGSPAPAEAERRPRKRNVTRN